MIEAIRIGDGPILQQAMCDSLGDNLNGPSLIARPDWAPGPGRLMLYFAHHKGGHIRLAFADRPEGPWQIHRPGVLPLAETPLAQTRPDTQQPAWARETGHDGLYPHLASPDVWLDHETRQVHMLFHGLMADGEQASFAATSLDGLDWHVTGSRIDETYMRRFAHCGQVYAMARLGILMRLTPDGTWQSAPQTIPGAPRHVAVMVRGDLLHVVFSRIGDAPERLLHTCLDLSGTWPDWQPIGPETELLRPNLPWEGAAQPIRPSFVGAVDFAHELRDPALFELDGETYLIYSGGGEHALGLARLIGF